METPQTSDLRKNFQEQLEKVTGRISTLRSELDSAIEFRTKLLGGLETLQILDPVEPESEEQTDPSETVI